MNKLAKREKILLYFLAVILLAVLPYIYVTRGLMAENEKLSAELGTLEKQRETYDFNEMNEKALNKKLSALQQKVLGLKIQGANISKSYDAHYKLTSLAQNNGVKVLGLSIGDPADVDIGFAETPPANAKENKVQRPMMMAVTLSLQGALPNILKLADDINAAGDYFIIENFSVGDITDAGSVNAQIGVGLYMALSLEERMQISGA